MLRPCLALLCLVCASPLNAAFSVERMQAYMQSSWDPAGMQALADWRAMLEAASTLDESRQLARVNTFFNRRIRFADDMEVWHARDYWATPLETLGKGAGDCEDFTIAKYFSLLELGVPASRLRLIYVRATIGADDGGIQVAHMVLGYYASPAAEPLVLDNLIGEIRPASRRPDLKPVFSFNSEGVFMAGSGQPTASVDRLTLWAGLLGRMKSQGGAP